MAPIPPAISSKVGRLPSAVFAVLKLSSPKIGVENALVSRDVRSDGSQASLLCCSRPSSSRHRACQPALSEKPPSTTICWPVMKSDSALLRNRIALAIFHAGWGACRPQPPFGISPFLVQRSGERNSDISLQSSSGNRAIQNEATQVRLPSNIKWLGREGSNLQMAESKSAEFTSKITEPSEFSPYVHPLTALVNFARSECSAP